MNCRLGLDWVACVVQLVGAIFFTIGFSTKYWATSESSVNAGLFTTCDSGYCYDTHVFYHGKSGKLTQFSITPISSPILSLKKIQPSSIFSSTSFFLIICSCTVVERNSCQSRASPRNKEQLILKALLKLYLSNQTYFEN